MHHLSAIKIQSLVTSLHHFESAASSLPQPITLIDDLRSSSTLSQSDVEDLRSLDDSASSVDPLSPRKSPPPYFENTREGPIKHQGYAAPLRIRRADGTGYRPISGVTMDEDLPFPPIETRLSPPEEDVFQAPMTPTPTAMSSEPAVAWLQAVAQRRYNEHLYDFVDTLTRHVAILRSLIEATQQAQATRYAATNSSAEDEADIKAATLKARILKLKARNWERERFQPEKYQRLCEKALDEL